MEKITAVPEQAEERVIVTRIDIPLLDVFVLVVKVAIASIPLGLLAWLIIKQL